MRGMRPEAPVSAASPSGFSSLNLGRLVRPIFLSAAGPGIDGRAGLDFTSRMEAGSTPSVNDAVDRWLRRALWLAYRVLRLWWYLARPHHHGAVIAIWFEGRILMVWHSYRDALSVPGGGIRSGEAAIDAVIRETREEVGISLDPQAVSLAAEVTERWEYRRDHVRIFETSLRAAPVVRPDGREVIAARFMDPPAALSHKLPPFLRDYLEQKLSERRRAGAAS